MSSEQQSHRVRSIIPTIWVCSCSGIDAWGTEAEAQMHIPTTTKEPTA